MGEPFTWLPERIHLELVEVELVLHSLNRLAESNDRFAAAADDLYHRLLGRLGPEYGELDDEGI